MHAPPAGAAPKPQGELGTGEEAEETPSRVQPRATDYLSAAVERRAQGRAAIATGDDLGGVEVSRKSPHPKRARTAPMEADTEEGGLALRPLKGPVTPVPKADLVPVPKVSVAQSSLIGRMAPEVHVEQEASEAIVPVKAAPVEPAAPATARRSVPPPGRETRDMTAKQPLEPWGRRGRSVEVPEPVERHHAPREFYVPEWDRYYNPGFLPGARIPDLRIDRRGGPPPDAPSWMLIGRPRGMGVVVEDRAPYRASLKDGARVKASKPEREVERFLAERSNEDGALELQGPTEVPEEPAGDREPVRRADFERALADLEASFQSDRVAPTRASPPPAAPAPMAPAPSPPVARAPAAARVAAPPPPAARTPAPSRQAAASQEVEAAASRAMPVARSSMRPVARRRGDEDSEEDEAEISPGEEEEGTLGRRPPPDHLQEASAHRALEHDSTGASLCPTCGRRVSASNPVLVCTSCGRVACASCGRFSAGEPTGNIYRYEYKFNFPLCQPCFERHYTVQQNLARGRAYLSSGNLTYAFYHAQTALQSDPESPYVEEAKELVKQVEQRRGQIQKADKEWEEARKKIMRDRTSVLK